MKIWTAGALAALVGACSTTGQATADLQSKWLGRPADEFFIKNGPPVSEFKLADGGTLYTWTSHERTMTLPALADTSFGPEGSTAETTITGGGTIHLRCSIQITASGAARTIQAIRSTRNDQGLWPVSECAEALSS